MQTREKMWVEGDRLSVYNLTKGGSMKNKHIPYYLMATIKLLYITLILLSLCLFSVAIDCLNGENEYFTYSLIDKLCTDLMVADFFLTGSSLMFIGLF